LSRIWPLLFLVMEKRASFQAEDVRKRSSRLPFEECPTRDPISLFSPFLFFFFLPGGSSRYGPPPFCLFVPFFHNASWTRCLVHSMVPPFRRRLVLHAYLEGRFFFPSFLLQFVPRVPFPPGPFPCLSPLARLEGKVKISSVLEFYVFPTPCLEGLKALSPPPTPHQFVSSHQASFSLNPFPYLTIINL